LAYHLRPFSPKESGACPVEGNREILHMLLNDTDDTNVDDKALRKKIRAERVAALLNGTPQGVEQESHEKYETNAKENGQKQISESMDIIEETKLKGMLNVTKVRVGAESLEKERRIEEAKLQDTRFL